ncbi:SPASM domain-containing protein [Puniceicoccaceae bacterium K14]|nr:SPASM domain-containing protein [Puniceicoccaceae bacterium K14]
MSSSSGENWRPRKTSECGKIGNCSHPWKSALINLNGDVHACPHGSSVLGNLKDAAFEKIWNGPAIQSMREHIRQGKLHPNCKTSLCPFQIDSAGSTEEEEWITFPATPDSNKELANREYNRRTKIVWSQPAMITLVVTSKCDMKCVMCPHGMGQIELYMDIPEIAISRLVGPLQAAGRIDITGVGEPVLSPSFWQFVETHKKVDGQMLLYKTSGVHITKESAKKLVNSAATIISVSIDAATPETYQKIRGNELSRTLGRVDKMCKFSSN